MKKLVDLNKSDIDEKIFFGEYNGFQRYDLVKYPFAKIIESNMRQAFWTPEEISLISDRENFKHLPEYTQQILINNLLFQTLMDSAQNRGLDAIMSELVTSPSWEAVFKTQAFFELIHSLSYSHIIREMFSSNATDIFDQIYSNEHIKHRTDREILAYSELKEYLSGNKKEWDTETTKKKILTLCIYIYFLEGLKFYVSFLVTYTINNYYDDAIPGVTKIIKLINHDEDMHVAVFAGLLKILSTSAEEGFTHLFKSDWFSKTCHEIVATIVNEEIQWAEYLLSIGQVKGLTIAKITEFMQYYANNRLEKISIKPLYKLTKQPEIIKFFDMYKNINKDNTAQQESTALNYNIGKMNLDYDKYDLDEEFKKLFNRNAE